MARHGFGRRLFALGVVVCGLGLGACSSDVGTPAPRLSWLPDPAEFNAIPVDCGSTVFARDLEAALQPEAVATTGLIAYECWRADAAGDFFWTSARLTVRLALATDGVPKVFPAPCWANPDVEHRAADGRAMSYVCQASVEFVQDGSPAVVTYYASVVLTESQMSALEGARGDVPTPADLAEYPEEWLVMVGVSPDTA